MTVDPFSHLDASSSEDPFAHLDAMAAQKAAKAQTGAWSSKLGRLVQGAAEPFVGAAQLAANVTGVGKQYMNRKAQEAADFAAQSSRAAGVAPGDVDWWNVAGNVVSPANLAPGAAIGRVGQAATAAGRLGRGVLAGGASGAMAGAVAPVTNISPTNDYGAQKEEQLLGGAAAGAILGPAASAIGRGLIPAAVPEARGLVREGVELTSGQMAGPGSWLKRLEDVGEKAPVVGGMIRGARERAEESFNRTGFNRVLEPINERLPQNIDMGHDAFNWVENRLSDRYRNVHSRVSLSRDAQLEQDLKDAFINNEVDLVESRQKQLMAFINKKITDRIDAHGGRIDGAEVQKITSELADKARKLARSTDADQTALGVAYRDVRSAVDAALQRQNPAHAPELRDINDSWGRLMILQDAMSSTANMAREGMFGPTQLGLAVKKGMTGREMARGTGRMQDLAEAGKKLIPANIGSSGTAERASTMHLIGQILSGKVNPQTALGMAAIPAIYSQPGQAALRRLMTGSTPQQMQHIGDILSRYAPMAAATGASSASNQ